MSDANAPVTSLGLDQYARVLLRQWRWVAACLAVGLAAAAAWLVIQPPRTTVTTQLNLTVITTDPFSPQRAASGLLDDATESVIATSHTVARRAAELLDDGVTATELRRAVEVTVSDGGTVARVSATADDPDDAVARADAVAAAYLEYRSAQARERVDLMLTSLTERIDALNAQLVEANRVLSDEPGPTSHAQATSDREQILVELEGLLAQRNTLQSVDTTAGNVLTAAADNTPEHAPSRSLTLATGGGAGLVLGIVIAFVRNRWDRRLRDASEMQRLLARPVLARLGDPLPAVWPSRANAAPLRVARERMLRELPHDGAVLLIADDTGDGGCAVATSLAVMMAQAGEPVTLVLAGLADERADDLRGALELDGGDPATSRAVSDLRVWLTGTGDGECLGARGRELARAPRPKGITLLALSTANGEADLLAGIRHADAAVLVLRERASTSTTARWFAEESEASGRSVLGVIAVPPRPRARRGTAITVPAARRMPARPARAGSADLVRAH